MAFNALGETGIAVNAIGPIYLARHGQTEWNLAGRLQGGKDSPLTHQGKRQAEGIAASLRDVRPTSILASPLGRASKTAKIIAGRLDIPIVEDLHLGELRFGEAEGLTLSEIDETWPDFLDEREQDKWRVRWPGGENYEDASRRIQTFIDETLTPKLAENGRSPLLIVGHETINMVLIGRLLTLEPQVITKIGQPNHVLYRLTAKDVDHAYLGDDILEWAPGLLQKHLDDIIHIRSMATS